MKLSIAPDPDRSTGKTWSLLQPMEVSSSPKSKLSTLEGVRSKLWAPNSTPQSTCIQMSPLLTLQWPTSPWCKQSNTYSCHFFVCLCRVFVESLWSLCRVFVESLPSLCWVFVESLSSLCWVFVESLSSLCPVFVKSVSRLSQVFFQSLSRLCQDFVKSLSNLCPVFVQSLSSLWSISDLSLNSIWLVFG